MAGGYLGADVLGDLFLGGGFTSVQRGNIDYDQIRSIARQGNGALFQMFAGTSPVDTHVLIYDGAGNATDGGGPPAIWVTAPAHHNSTGVAGQAAYDGSGNLYICYATNSWAKFAPTSTSF